MNRNIPIYGLNHPSPSQVLIRLYRDDLYVTGTLTEVESKILSISLFEHNFVAMSGGTADLATMKFILSDITKVEITTIFPESAKHDQKIRGMMFSESFINPLFMSSVSESFWADLLFVSAKFTVCDR